MKTVLIIVMGMCLSVLMACSKKNEVVQPSPSLVEKQPITSADAINAINAFHTNFYSTSEKLYYSSTEHKNLAAIWTQAIFWDMNMNAYQLTKNPDYLQRVEAIYQGAYQKYDKFNWENRTEWFIYDDMMWWIISLARAYELTGEEKYLIAAKAGFERVWRDSYDPKGGGMYWAFDHRGKTACINYPTVIGAMTLYRITKDETYLQKAKDVYSWVSATLFDHNTGKVADHKVGTEPTNWKVHTYNQATCIGAGVMLFMATKTESYLKEAILAADYTKNIMSDSKGIMPFETGIEQGIYTAIFAQYIIRLIEDGKQPQYLPWLKLNIETGWRNRDARSLTYKNFNIPCPSGVVESYDASGAPALMQLVVLP